MNKWFLVGLLCVNPVYAEYDLCTSIARTAEQIMIGRQSGVLMEVQMKALDSAEMPEIKNVFSQIIITAYGIPKYESESVKASTVTEFRNKVYLQCIKP